MEFLFALFNPLQGLFQRNWLQIKGVLKKWRITKLRSKEGARKIGKIGSWSRLRGRTYWNKQKEFTGRGSQERPKKFRFKFFSRWRRGGGRSRPFVLKNGRLSVWNRSSSSDRCNDYQRLLPIYAQTLQVESFGAVYVSFSSFGWR